MTTRTIGMKAVADPTLWLAMAERLLKIPIVQWAPSEQRAAVELLTAGMVLLRCKTAVPKSDAQTQLVERANCLARCADDLARDIVAAMPSSC